MSAAGAQGTTLITGGAGFIGSNLAARLLESGERVIVFDDLSRAGVGRNAAWLRERFGWRVELVIGDVRDASAVARAVARADQVFHLAAQVAVTTSLEDPVRDFDVNARGTLQVLDAIRTSSHRPPLFFTSTNKVYGALPEVALRATDTRYEPEDDALRASGVDERRPLDLHSPYGCSKGAADQYVLDHARSFGLRTCVFRMSCIYGPRQFGTEDQGWVAHFLIRALAGEPITIYGDGRQVRDLLFVADLVDAFLAARERIDAVSGQAFNVGGGPRNTTSLVDLLATIESLHGRPPRIERGPWRVGDQRYYVSDTSKLTAATGWRPRVGVLDGVQRLDTWLRGGRGASRSQAAVEVGP
jgi:CDP-paratose 2-epimerase